MGAAGSKPKAAETKQPEISYFNNMCSESMLDNPESGFNPLIESYLMSQWHLYMNFKQEQENIGNSKKTCDAKTLGNVYRHCVFATKNKGAILDAIINSERIPKDEIRTVKSLEIDWDRDRDIQFRLCKFHKFTRTLHIPTNTFTDESDINIEELVNDLIGTQSQPQVDFGPIENLFHPPDISLAWIP